MQNPDAIVVLAGGVKEDASGRWVSTDLTEYDDTQGAPGASLRVAATAILSNRYPAVRVIASGGKGYDVPKNARTDRPLLCEIVKGELITAGVPEEHIELEGASNTTYQQLQQLETLMQKREGDNVAIVSSRWHLPRIETMLEMKFPKLRTSVHLVSAEDLLIKSDRTRWHTVIDKAYKSAFMLERIAKENKGILQIRNGTYHFQ